MSWLHDMTTEFLEQVQEAKDKKVFPFFRPFQNLGPRVKIGRRSYINFTSNDYLGLSQDKRLIQSAVEGIEQYGTGLGSARLQATSDKHELLEERIAAWLGREACATFTTGYQAMVGILSTFADDDTLIAMDKLSHACILDGAALARGNNPDMELRTFKHNSAKMLDRVLRETEKKKKLVVVEGLYSVDGDLAPLADLIAVCKKHGAVVLVDDAHGIGALGPTGRGTAELMGVLGDIDLLYGSFSKCFGGIGGFLVADRVLIDFLKLKARSFVYSASLPVAQIQAASRALDIIQADRSYQRSLEKNRDFFRQGLLSLGFNLGDSVTHITPIMIGEEIRTLTFGAYLYHGAGVIMMPFIYPGVPPGKARLRCNVTALHNESDMGYALEAVAEIGRQLEVISPASKTKATRFQKALWVAKSKVSAVQNAGIGELADDLEKAAGKVRARVETLRKGGTTEPAPKKVSDAAPESREVRTPRPSQRELN